MSTMKEEIGKEKMLAVLSSVKVRAEKQTDADMVLETFQPVIDFNALATPNTQIIYGRNGTGKTHLLNAFYKYCEVHFEEKKILPVIVDCKDLDLGPVLPRIPLNELIIRFYRRFIYKVADRLQEFSESIITPNLLQKLFGSEVAERKSAIEHSLARLKSILNEKQIEERLQKYLKKIDLQQSAGASLKEQIGVSASISSSKTGLGVSGGIEMTAEEQASEKEKIELVYGGMAVIDYEQIRQELDTIIQQSGAVALVVLVDEWSSVSLPIQPILAEMVRKTLAISNRIYLKIVALKYWTQTSAEIDPPQQIGLQPGIDINQLADLDALLSYDRNPQAVKDFLTLVGYKHASQEFEALRNYDVSQFEEYLCNEIFENEDVYFELIRSSEGNPRDFLCLLGSACVVAHVNPKAKMSLKQTILIAADYFHTSKLAVIEGDKKATALYDRIFDTVVQNRQKLFLVTSDRAAADSRLNKLWHYRFIHLVHPNYERLGQDGKRHSYQVFSMDYGKLVALRRESAGQTLVDTMCWTAEMAGEKVFPIIGGTVFEHLVKAILEKTVVGARLKQVTGKLAVALKGVEAADFSDSEYLISNCLIDDLLDV